MNSIPPGEGSCRWGPSGPFWISERHVSEKHVSEKHGPEPESGKLKVLHEKRCLAIAKSYPDYRNGGSSNPENF